MTACTASCVHRTEVTPRAGFQLAIHEGGAQRRAGNALEGHLVGQTCHQLSATLSTPTQRTAWDHLERATSRRRHPSRGDRRGFTPSGVMRPLVPAGTVEPEWSMRGARESAGLRDHRDRRDGPSLRDEFADVEITVDHSVTRLRLVSTDPAACCTACSTASPRSAWSCSTSTRSTKDHPVGGEAAPPDASVRSPRSGPARLRRHDSESGGIAMAIGPVEYIIVGFPGNKFNGEIAPELGKLVESGTIRILDLVFITKDADGNVAGRRVRGPRRRRPLQRPRGRGRRAHQRGGRRVRRRRARAQLLGRPAHLGGRLGDAVRRGHAQLGRRADRGLAHPPRPDRSRRSRARRRRLTDVHPSQPHPPRAPRRATCCDVDQWPELPSRPPSWSARPTGRGTASSDARNGVAADRLHRRQRGD